MSVIMCLCCTFSVITKVLESFNVSSQRTSASVDLCLHCAFSNKFAMRCLFVHFAAVTLELLMLGVLVVFDKCVSMGFSMDGMV